MSEEKNVKQQQAATDPTLAKTGAVDSDTHQQQSVTSFDSRTPAKNMLLAKVYTPFKTFFEGDARSITAVNETGQFDILPGHHNFITMLLPCDLVVEDEEKKKQVIPIRRGLMHVKQDKLIIFLDV